MSGKKRKASIEKQLNGTKRQRVDSESDEEDEQVAGKVKRIFMKNFMCHDAMEVKFNPRVNFIVGANGSGKSAILTALTVCLGAGAKKTNRGSSIKGFIKKGKNSAMVEVTITNNGPMAYRYKTYGDSITVIRTIGPSSSYKIKNYKGEIISTKKQELDNICNALNVQVDNPISILNQDVARSFLMSTASKDKYNLFIKSTRLDIIGDNYKKAQEGCDETKMNLDEAKKYLNKNQKEVDQLKTKLRALESLDKIHNEHEFLKKELLWADVIQEEKKLLQIETHTISQEKEIEELQNLEANKNTKEKEIDSKIRELKTEIAKAEAEAAVSNERMNEMKNTCMEAKRTANEKQEKVRLLHSTIERHEGDIIKLQSEIKRLERENSVAGERKQQAKQKIEEFEQQLDEIEATLRTRQTDLMHLEENKSRIEQDDHKLKVEIEQQRNTLNKQKQRLNAFKNQPNDSSSVYGANMPRLLKRIEEEYQRGKFRHKPLGPIGSFIKMKDSSWIPAVENHLGFGTLSQFCVDNNHDRHRLELLMKEVFRGERLPNIVISTFFGSMHNVLEGCTKSARYQNLLEAMEIAHPVIANSLIDQREIECILLIPTSDEANVVMSEAKRVPPNCKRVITKNGDLFYPDPQYRIYGGSVTRPRYLQVSTNEAIQSLQEEIVSVEDKLHFFQQEYSELKERMQKNRIELTQTQKQVRNLKDRHIQLKNKIDENKEIIDNCNDNIINSFMMEMEDLQRIVEQRKEEERILVEEHRQAQKYFKEMNDEFRKCRDIAHNLDAKLNPIKEHIKDLGDEKRRLIIMNKDSNKKIEEAKRLLQKFSVEHHQQQRVVNSKLEVAEKIGLRINTTKTIAYINSKIEELEIHIKSTEKQLGTKDEICKILEEKETKYQRVKDFAVKLEASNAKHHRRLLERKQFYFKMKKEITERVQVAFENVLKLRNYKGRISIDHKKMELDLEVIPLNDAKRNNNDAKTLSGGERSYSTVAFILALWDCTGLPFYFLDEFDVFMDKVNRRMVMDILLSHAHAHYQCQFAFLTPLDTSNVMANDNITIHRLAPPERSS